MFKKIQNHLLLHHPLLWNTKFVPTLIVTLGINLIFFLIGYSYGAIDFIALEEKPFRNTLDFITGFSILISSLVLIIWLVFYLKNNAFKSFYPKKTNSLYKEWLLILIICIVNCMYSITFDYAYNLRGRNYFDKATLEQRLDLLSRASIFIDGSYKDIEEVIIYNENYHTDYDYQYDSDEEYIEYAEPAIDTTQKDSACYYANSYPGLSLMNKNLINYSLNRWEKDSVNEYTVKRWMFDQQKDSIQKLMEDFFKLAKSHGLTSSITPKKWMELSYRPKLYHDNIHVAADSLSPIHDGHYDNDYNNYNVYTDSVHNFTKMVHGKIEAFPKYYVPFTQLNVAYGMLSEAWTRPIGLRYMMLALCFGFSISLVIFSFRVTSGKSWLIAAISLGLAGIITFILVMLIPNYIIKREEVVFIVIWLLITKALSIWFFTIYRKKTTKGISEIIVNLLIWLLPTVSFMIWILVISYTDYMSPAIFNADDPYYILNQWMGDNITLLFYGSMLIVIIYMYFLTRAIKKWKGIAEA